MHNEEHLPQARWILWFLAGWVLLGMVPISLVLIGKHYFSLVDSEAVATAGVIGDSFGLVNSFFSSAALLFIIWSLKLQRQEMQFSQQEWMANTEAQKHQAELMKQAANLTAINHVYQHFSEEIELGPNSVSYAIAEGHRRWAIRVTFNTIDPSFEEYNRRQVEIEYRELLMLLKCPSLEVSYLNKVASAVASLLAEHTINDSGKNLLKPIYELIRKGVDGSTFKEFEAACSNLAR